MFLIKWRNEMRYKIKEYDENVSKKKTILSREYLKENGNISKVFSSETNTSKYVFQSLEEHGYFY